jgi:hypothetical protein
VPNIQPFHKYSSLRHALKYFPSTSQNRQSSHNHQQQQVHFQV